MTTHPPTPHHLIVRPVRPDDKALLRRAFARLSPESRYRRFLTSATDLSEEDLAYLTDVDHKRHEALVAIDPRTGEGVGVARYVAHPGQRDTAEVAVAVIDEWQGRGVGRALLERLADRACGVGIRRCTALVSPDNRRVIDALSRLGATRARSGSDGALEFSLELDRACAHGTPRKGKRDRSAQRVVEDWAPS